MKPWFRHDDVPPIVLCKRWPWYVLAYDLIDSVYAQHAQVKTEFAQAKKSSMEDLPMCKCLLIQFFNVWIMSIKSMFDCDRVA